MDYIWVTQDREKWFNEHQENGTEEKFNEEINTYKGDEAQYRVWSVLNSNAAGAKDLREYFLNAKSPCGKTTFDNEKQKEYLNKNKFLEGDEFTVYFREIFVEEGEDEQKLFQIWSTYKREPVNLKIKKIDASTGEPIGESKNLALNLEGDETVYNIFPSSPLMDGSDNTLTIQVYPTALAKGVVNVKITETITPAGYVGLDSPLELTIKYDESTRKVTDMGYVIGEGENSTTLWATANGGVIDNDFITCYGSDWVLRIKNTPIINISGQVWEDVYRGEKKEITPDGIKQKDDEMYEKGLKGIIVELYESGSTEIAKDVDGNLLQTTTGEYGLYGFNNIKWKNGGYKVKFKYNGIDYIETKMANDKYFHDEKYGGDSKGNESAIDRVIFNSRFNTIDGKGAHTRHRRGDCKFGI